MGSRPAQIAAIMKNAVAHQPDLAKHVWVSVNYELCQDAKRDMKGVGGSGRQLELISTEKLDYESMTGRASTRLQPAQVTSISPHPPTNTSDQPPCRPSHPWPHPHTHSTWPRQPSSHGTLCAGVEERCAVHDIQLP